MLNGTQGLAGSSPRYAHVLEVSREVHESLGECGGWEAESSLAMAESGLSVSNAAAGQAPQEAVIAMTAARDTGAMELGHLGWLLICRGAAAGGGDPGGHGPVGGCSDRPIGQWGSIRLRGLPRRGNQAHSARPSVPAP